MEVIAEYRHGEMQRAEITAALFSDFVRFLDRGEKTTRTYLTNLRQFMAWLRYTGIKQPQREDIQAFRDWLLSEHTGIAYAPETASGWVQRVNSAGNPVTVSCRPATVKAYLQSVKQFFSWAASRGVYPNIAANIHPPKVSSEHKKDSLTAAEVLTVERSILNEAAQQIREAEQAVKDSTGKTQRSTERGKRLYAMYLLAVNAGLRTVELSRANIRDIETKNGAAWLYVWGKGRNEPDQKKIIVPEVMAAINDYIASRTDQPTGSSPLFVSTGNRSRGKRLAPTTISTMLKRAMQAAGFNSDRLTAHSLRHTTAQNALDQTGGNIYRVQMYLRHSNPATTERYLDNDSSQDAELARQLWDRYHTESSRPSAGEDINAIAADLSPAERQILAEIARSLSGQHRSK